MKTVPAVTKEEWDEIAEGAVPLAAIDLIRPDNALLRGKTMQAERRAGKTEWKAAPRGERKPHQGKREMARRAKQLLRAA